jgi:hypothetical protein
MFHYPISFGGRLHQERGGEALIRRSEGELRVRVEGPGQLLFVQDDRCILVPVDDRQVGIRILCFSHEFRMNVVRLRAGEPTLAGAEADEHELVVFATLELKGPAVGPIRKDRLTDLPQRQRTTEAGRIGGCQIADDLTKEATQILHG